MSTTEKNELRTLLGDVVTRLFTERVTADLITSAEQGTWPAALWQAVEENGLTLPLLPEAKGGAGGTWQDAYVVIHAAGRHAVPMPLPETIVAAWLLADAGLDIPEGPMAIAPDGRDDKLFLERNGNGWRLSGTATRVPWGSTVGHLVVVAPAGSHQMVALVAGGQARVASDKNLALEPRDTLTFERTPVVAAAPAPPAVKDGIRSWGAMIRSAQTAGALEAVLSQSVKYVTERHQFGRAIGSFQAIQHSLAIVAGQTASAGLAASNAFRAAERAADAGTAGNGGGRRDPAFEIAVAKVRVGEAAGVAAGLGHQVHGAIGFTYEHSLHFLTRRLWSWRAEFGGESEWAAVLGRETAARGADALWPYLTSR